MKSLLLVTVSMLVACHASLCLAGVPRVALMPSGDQKASAIVELMEVELAERDDLVLLDRANVGRMLAEQRIVMEGLLSSDDAFAIGQLLGCDVFGELFFQAKGDGASAVGVLTAFDAVTGVRLCDATLDASGSLQAISEAAGKILLEALQKRTDAVSWTNVRAVTLLSVRNVDLPPGQAHLPEAMGPMLERQLLRSAGITVLERKRLDRVNQEAALTQDLRERLLSSTVLLDIDLSRGASGDDVIARVTVSDNAGNELAVVAVEFVETDINSLVQTMVPQLLGVLKLPAVIESDNMAKQEAARFVAESRRLQKRNRQEDALAAVECAHALNPGDFKIQALLCNSLWDKASEYANNQEYDKLFGLLDRTWSFREQWMDEKDIRSTAGVILRLVLANKEHLDSEQQVRLKQIQGLFRQLVMARYIPQSKARLSDLWAASPSEWMDGLFELSKRYPKKVSAYEYFRPNGKYHPFIYQLPKERKLKLMELNTQRAKDGDPRGFIECMFLAHYMPDVFDDAEGILQRNLDGLVDMAIQDKSSTGLIAYVAEQLLLLRSDIGAALIHPAMLRLQEEIDTRRVVCPVMITYFEFYDGAGNRGKYITNFGGYTAEVARKLVDGYSVSTNRYVNACGIDYRNGRTTDPDYLLAKCMVDYKRRTRKELVLEGLPATAKVPHWASQEKIYEISWAGKRHSCIQSVAQQDNLVFLAIYRRGQNPRTTLMEFDLASGAQRTVSSVDGCVEPNFKKINRFEGVQYLHRGNMSVGESVVCLPGANGVILFPRNGAPPHLLQSGEELPDLSVNSAIEFNGSLYLALDRKVIRGGRYESLGGMLLQSDLNGDNQTVLASSERKKDLSPLDNCDPYFIDGFVHDAENGRLYFMISGAWSDRNMGIWRYELGSGEITPVWKARGVSLFGDFAPQKDGTIWFANGGGILLWKPVDERLSRVLGNTNKSGLRPQFIGETTHSSISPTCCAIVNGVLYARSQKPFTNLMKYGLVYFEEESARAPTALLKPFDKHAPFYLQEWQGMLVAVDESALWLLKPNKEN